MNSDQETPYQIALREHPPLPKGSWITYYIPVQNEDVIEVLGPRRSGEIFGHRIKWENNVFKHWVYYVIPFGARQGKHVLFTDEIPATHLFVKD